MIALLIGMLVGLLWAAINVTVWNLTAISVLKMDPHARRPFHWTVLVGPFAYYPWLSRREEVATHQIANTTPPTLAEISGEYLIPPRMAAAMGKRFAEGIYLEDVEPAVPYDGPVKALMSPYERSTVMNGRGETIETPQLGVPGPRTQLRAFMNEYSERRIGVEAMSLFPVRKYGGHMLISRDTLVAYGLVEPTPEEQARMDASHAAYEVRKKAATDALPGFLAALAAVTDPVARAVLDLHKASERAECHGCEADGYDWEHPYWPCATTTTVATALGIPVPADLDMANGALALAEAERTVAERRQQE